jgi:galactose mutarotase-like enzyme
MDEATFTDPVKNVRGGIPILYPNAGPIDDPRYPGMKQHGFARNSDQWKSMVSADGRTLTDSLETEATEQYPHASTLTLSAELSESGSVVLTQTAENRGTEPMPVAMGLHPYFKVAPEQKKNIRFAFAGGEHAEQEAATWMEGGTLSLDNPAVDNPNATLEVVLPGVGTLTLLVSPVYKKIWLWSLAGQDFICIEPVMRDIGGLVNDPELIPSGESLSGTLSLHLQPETSVAA